MRGLGGRWSEPGQGRQWPGARPWELWPYLGASRDARGGNRGERVEGEAVQGGS